MLETISLQSDISLRQEEEREGRGKAGPSPAESEFRRRSVIGGLSGRCAIESQQPGTLYVN